ncbi:SusD/RagB family lipoprotein [Zobellia roscoffensis]|uniref:RagB/SusD family nutrient uptake outer membrane protein n=1 Tax=Zobellia roscoffensis TaxID=2779508 RepID=UPI00188AD821|nr:RagB/SusD family nutrient uptake outer membrane protein [Zobellia roscoffensis]
MKKNILFCFGVALLGISCSNDFTEVVPSNNVSTKEVFTDISRAQSFLNPAYGSVRNSPWISLDAQTHNVVSKSGPSRTAVSGATAESSPVSGEWNSAIGKILHINEFFEKGFNVTYDAFDEEFAEALKKRIRGEAFGLRAYYKWILLKNFAGPSAQDPNTMLGIPIIDEVLTIDNTNDIPRSTYMQSYANIQKDLDSALTNINLLRYAGDGDVDGVRLTSRISGEMIWALRARMALFAASPAFEQISWEEAANTAYDAIAAIDEGAIKDLQPFGNFNNVDNPDHFWRRSFSENGSLESQNFPPSLFGNGDWNPSQNLVEVFPDSLGYPITDPNSIYDPVEPYANRDPRFERFVFHNGENEFRNAFIEVFAGGKDAQGGIRKQATRSGYYLKKFLSDNINLDVEANANKEDYKVYPIFDRGGLYLDFAEAAIEAYGIAGKGGDMVFSAKEVLSVIRKRAGISTDQYLDLAISDLKAYRNLIRNERRIEYAFEGEYYYDLRRWKVSLEELNQPVLGIEVGKEASDKFNYTATEIESRSFEEYMYYNPIPRNEVLKSNTLIQNFGWQ